MVEIGKRFYYILGHALGNIAYALQVIIDLEYRKQEPEINGYRAI